jgi:NADH:ubiquinone oxidoreductase subunit
MTVTTRLYTFFCGKQVGSDQFGNRYYIERNVPRSRRRKRWVIYHGIAEPSKVPPEWHGWLHYTLDQLPATRKIPHYNWQKPHLPNLTGTKGAYVPPGHLLGGAHRSKTTSDYEPWKP